MSVSAVRAAALVTAVLAAAPLALDPSAARATGTAGEIDEVAVDGPSFTRKPRWELGVGGGVFFGRDYPASNDPNRRAIALPFLVYRSPVFRIGGGSVRAVAIERPRLRLDLSVGASFSASSEDNGSRDGMPDLDFLFELGPQLELRLIDRVAGEDGRVQLGFVAELRAVVATDFRGIGAQGFVAEIGVEAARRRVFDTGLDVVGALGVTFADERLQDYFYEVEPEYARPARAAYDARGGYLGTELSLGVVIRPSETLRVFLGVQSGLYAGAANEESPLFETTASTGAALGVAWTFARSARTIDIVEID